MANFSLFKLLLLLFFFFLPPWPLFLLLTDARTHTHGHQHSLPAAAVGQFYLGQGPHRQNGQPERKIRNFHTPSICSVQILRVCVRGKTELFPLFCWPCSTHTHTGWTFCWFCFHFCFFFFVKLARALPHTPIESGTLSLVRVKNRLLLAEEFC